MEQLNNHETFWTSISYKGPSVTLLNRFAKINIANKYLISILMAIEFTAVAFVLTESISSLLFEDGHAAPFQWGTIFVYMLLISFIGQFAKKIEFSSTRKKITVTVLFSLLFLAVLSYLIYSMNKISMGEPVLNGSGQITKLTDFGQLDMLSDKDHQAIPSGGQSRISDFQKLDTGLLLSSSDKELSQSLQRVNDEFGGMFNDITDMFKRNSSVDNWQAFMASVDEKTSERPFLLDLYALQAIQKKAPVSVIVDLVNRGAQLQGNHISSIASKYSVEEIKLLQSYGVDFSLADDLGSNALVSSVFNVNSVDVFDYLLSIGVPAVDSNSDLLLKMLEISEKMGLPSSFVEKMLVSGAELNSNHYEWLIALEKRNPNYYNMLSHLVD